MSRGFVKEDDQEEIPILPQRAYLPQGVTNFVTPSGMDQLLAEKQALISERDNLNITSENEKRIAGNFINAKLQLLNNRIASARIVNPDEQPKNEIRISASVTLKTEASGEIQTFHQTSVDDAAGRVAINFSHNSKSSFVHGAVVVFNVPAEENMPFPIAPLTAFSIIAITLVSAGMLVYFRKHKHRIE
jgi:transcription elongation factor GreB